MKSLIRKHYDGKRHVQKLVFEDEFGEPQAPITEQSHKTMCDINNVIRMYDKTGLITHVNQATASYGDYSEINEYQDALNLVLKAQDNFNLLPAEIRKKFGNNPGQFFEFATDPDNFDEMVALGLAEAPPQDFQEEPTPTPQPRADPPPEDA